MEKSIRDVSHSLRYAETDQAIQKQLDYGRGGGLGESFVRLLSGESRDDVDRTALNAKRLMTESFAGNPLQCKGFLARLTGDAVFSRSLGQLPFNAFVESGAAAKLATLEKAHPKAFEAALSGSYADLASLNQALDRITTTANAEKPLGAGRVSTVTIPASNAGTPNDLPCAVTKRGGMSCDWDKAQLQGSPLEQEAAHLLKAGAQLLEDAGKTLQAPAVQGPKPK